MTWDGNRTRTPLFLPALFLPALRAVHARAVFAGAVHAGAVHAGAPSSVKQNLHLPVRQKRAPVVGTGSVGPQRGQVRRGSVPDILLPVILGVPFGEVI